MADQRGSLFEPNERKPEWALPPEEFTKLACEQCGRRFEADAARGVKGGLMILYDDDAPGGKRYYHGYMGQPGSCYARALRDMGLDG